MPKARLHKKSWPDHPALRATVELEVPFHDADPSGVAWHGNYFRYYDAARVVVLERYGFGYRQMAEIGQVWPIIDTRVRYLRSAQFNDLLTVETRLVEWEFRLRFYYQVFAADGGLINEAETLQVPVDAASNELIVGTPEFVVKRINAKLAGTTP